MRVPPVQFRMAQTPHLRLVVGIFITTRLLILAAHAVAAKSIPQSDVKPGLIERVKLHHDAELDQTIQKLWAAACLPPEEKQARRAAVAKILKGGKVLVPRDHLQRLQASPSSRIPDGLLDPLSDEQIRDLFAYLESKAVDIGADEASSAWRIIQPFFHPPSQFANHLGSYRSPLLFKDGSSVKTPAEWPRRRAEILREWTELMGEWPLVIEKPAVETLSETRRDNIIHRRVRIQLAPNLTGEGWLLVPEAKEPLPAVLVVYYEPETSVGRNPAQPLRDFALQLARRGFVTLSIGAPGGDAWKPTRGRALCQPLSFHAYVAANCWHALANLPQVARERIGVVGHSFGGKWAMFAAALWDKFACVAASDPGVVFDESRPNVNYWEPWYLGFDPAHTRQPGLPTTDNPRTAAYRQMIERGRDLHELHALISPRPFLVSGGAEDQPSRWIPLNHALAVNQFLGFTNRVALTHRESHDPTETSNKQLYAFFEHFLKFDARNHP